MVKIKRKVEMTLAELIDWGFKNNIENRGFVPNQANHRPVVFNSNGWIDFSDNYSYPPGDIFTVEVEEEITKETEIPKLVSINRNNLNEVNINFNCSIGQFLDRSDYNYYILNDDSTLTLIWKDGELVGDE